MIQIAIVEDEEIYDKYILEAAQCLEQKKKSDISSQKKIKLFNESNDHAW